MIPSQTLGSWKTSQPVRAFPVTSIWLSFAPYNKHCSPGPLLHSLWAEPSQNPSTTVHPCNSHPLPWITAELVVVLPSRRLERGLLSRWSPDRSALTEAASSLKC
jgi:hypothetical protein